MKNIAPLIQANDAAECDSDLVSYRAIVAKSRRPHKTSLNVELESVALVITEYTQRLDNGTSASLGFVNDVHDHHYSLYDSQMVPVKALKKTLIDLHAGENCPYCQIDTVSHIDHFLPRDTFPELSVSLQNLLMSCDICNSKYKQSKWGNGNDQPVFHPRYNTISEHSYLEAHVQYEQNTIVVTFDIRTDFPDSALLTRHFETMGLKARYKAKIIKIEIPKIVNVLKSEQTVEQKIRRLGRWAQDQVDANPENSCEYAFYSGLQLIISQVAEGGL